MDFVFAKFCFDFSEVEYLFVFGKIEENRKRKQFEAYDFLLVLLCSTPN